VIREVFEKGVASIVARYLLEGSADAVLERVAKAGVLTPDQLERLRHDSIAHLQHVRDEGAPYAQVVLQALQEAGKVLPLGAVTTAAASAVSAAPWRSWAAAARVQQAATVAAEADAALRARASDPAAPTAQGVTGGSDAEVGG
jgi:hypothetical protein